MEFQTIEIDDIEISKDNPRIIDEKSASFLALVETVKKVGVAIPIHVELGAKGKYIYLLRAGERRIRAAKKVGLKEIDAIVYKAGTAQGIMHLENFERKDLTLFEQIKSVMQLMTENTDFDWLANQMGVDNKTIHLLINVTKGLSETWHKLLTDEHGGWNNWTLEMLSEIAKYSLDVQNEYAGNFEDDSWQRIDITGLKEVKDDLKNFGNLLSQIPWPLDKEIGKLDYEVSGKPYETCSCCNDCKDNTNNVKMLFPEITDPKKAKCLSKACMQAKYRKYMDNCSLELGEIHESLFGVYPKGVYSLPYDSKDIMTSVKKTFIRIDDSCTKTTKKDEDAKLGIFLAGKSAGSLVYIKISKVSNATSASSDSTGDTAKKSASEKTYKEKLAELVLKRWWEVIERVRKKIATMKFAECPVAVDKLERMAVLFGISKQINYSALWLAYNTNQSLLNKNILSENQYKYLWSELQSVLDDHLRQTTIKSAITKSEIAICKLVCHEFQIDHTIIMKSVETTKGYTIPKSWKK